MSLRYFPWELMYSSFESDILNEFYKPALLKSEYYKRISGYFSANFLDNLAKEIEVAVHNYNLKIKVLCSPQMSDKDLEDIKLGYALREKIEEVIIRKINSISIENEEIPYIASLIAKSVLDIKFVMPKNQYGIFHDKKGVFCDNEGNKIAFTGSNNETSNALYHNFESFTVLNNWENKNHVEKIEDSFDSIWNEENENLEVVEITPDIQSAFEKKAKKIIEQNKPTKYSKINIRKKYELYDYQEEAIVKWKQNGHRGLLEMATGTGKTITALACYQEVARQENKMITIITVPQIELLYQWQKDLENGGTLPIICSSDNSNWKKELNSKIRRLRTEKEGHVTAIITRDSFVSKDFQQILSLNANIPKLLISDEVHSFGSDTTRRLYSKLDSLFEYRLGISATPFRKSDKESEELINFFEGIVFSYTLKEAIKKGFLNDYEYIPIVLYFDILTLESYRKSIHENMDTIKKKNAVALKTIEKLTSSVANSSTAKVDGLIRLIKENKENTQSIIYCSPGTYNDGVNTFKDRHIEHVANRISQENIKFRIIRSNVETEERKKILQHFQSKDINSLLAIKCLDQGINLPEVSHAYVLSSTDSLTEFIQRRGRILRTYEGKPTSIIYDFVMLPQDYRSLNFDPDIADSYLVERELKRMRAYNDAANNYRENDDLIKNIEDAYRDILEEEALYHVRY